MPKEIVDKLTHANVPKSEWPIELKGKIKQGTTKARLNEIDSELMANNIISGSGLKVSYAKRKVKKNKNLIKKTVNTK